MAHLIVPSGLAVTRDKVLSQTDAEMLRNYKKFLQKYGMRESLYCMKCDEQGLLSGLRASVMDDKIDFECRCTVRRYRGQTY